MLVNVTNYIYYCLLLDNLFCRSTYDKQRVNQATDAFKSTILPQAEAKGST